MPKVSISFTEEGNPVLARDSSLSFKLKKEVKQSTKCPEGVKPRIPLVTLTLFVTGLIIKKILGRIDGPIIEGQPLNIIWDEPPIMTALSAGVSSYDTVCLSLSIDGYYPPAQVEGGVIIYPEYTTEFQVTTFYPGSFYSAATFTIQKTLHSCLVFATGVTGFSGLKMLINFTLKKPGVVTTFSNVGVDVP